MVEMVETLETVAAEFTTPDAVVLAARRVRALGYGRVEAYTPFPLEELDEALARPRPRLPLLVFLAGGGGATLALAIQWWTNAWDYPLDVGGRPHASWPTYVPIVFETAVLCAAAVAFAAVLLGSRLPRLHDEVFDLPGFERSTIDRFWLRIEDVARDEEPALRAALAGAVGLHGLGGAS
ncbi:MAG: DUF3341 domain-containing protein [Labilithrix sp.]|nr:DUF3341 domain-containing protein [Labilithrix sp.]MCW5815674.1 DUF3341 domain-containing protein [Labilithrix sp.]